MKGGGIVIMLFLFICFIWGIATVVGGIRKLVQPRLKAAEPAPKPLGEHSMDATEPPSLHQTIASLRQIQELREGSFIDETEFKRLKTMLLTPLTTASCSDAKAD